VVLNDFYRKFFGIRNKLESLQQYNSKLRLDDDKLKKIFTRYISKFHIYDLKIKKPTLIGEIKINVFFTGSQRM
jgi:regulator of replication initiation timing